MTEPKELKAGDTAEVKVGGETLIVEPIPYGRLKKVLTYVAQAVNDIGGGAQMDNKVFLENIPVLLEKHTSAILPLLIDNKKHPFFNTEWIDDNLTIPALRDIIEKAIAVNGMKDFFAQLKPKGVVTEKSLTESPSATTPTR